MPATPHKDNVLRRKHLRAMRRRMKVIGGDKMVNPFFGFTDAFLRFEIMKATFMLFAAFYVRP